ncbi:MAG: phenylacetate--CoA ligase family protein [Halobacteriota archaeon]
MKNSDNVRGYWQQHSETLPLEQLSELQSVRLQRVVERVYAHVPFYRRQFKQHGVTPEDIRSVEDIHKLPFTRKTDLRDNFPFGLFAVPRDRVVRIHSSSGTSGHPTVVGYTARDISTWANMMARCLTMVGINRGDVFQNAVSYGLFTGGLGMHYGAELLGAMVVPSGTGGTVKQIEMMRNYGVTAVHATPSYALYLGETAKEMGLDPKQDLPLKIGCFGAEPWSYNTRSVLERELGIQAFDSYGLSEMNGPGVAFECKEQNGLHFWSDHFVVEVLKPDGTPCAKGERGELVLTSLTKEALPLIRYRTGDVTSIKGSDCPCGRTSILTSKILGRVDDMLVIRGINVFPSQIEHVLMSIPEVGTHFQVVLERIKHLDEMKIRVELENKYFTGEVEDLQRLTRSVETELRNSLNLRTKVELVERGTIARSEGKSKKIIDLRGEL